MPLNTLSVLLNSRKRVGNNVSNSSGRYLGSLVASLQPMLIHGSYLGESMKWAYVLSFSYVYCI